MKRFFHKHRYIIWLVLFLALLLVINFINLDVNGVFSSRESLKIFIESFGAFAPFVLIFIIALEVIVAPIPGFIPALTAGFVFGSFWGAFYVYLGNIIGSLVVFYLVRYYGRSWAEKLFNKKRMIRYEKALGQHENWLLFFYFFPILPLDVLTATFGLSKIKPKKFIIVIVLGYLVYSIILAFFGDLLAEFYFKII
ncbi:MAG: VTT domain-containing protein [Patescibacteria group bacterium]|nr:VTT domain-containing protein [Patescibacteria group bacterium]